MNEITGPKEAHGGSTLVDSALTTLQQVIDAIPYHVLLVDEHHRIIAANQALASRCGLERDALIGQHCPQAIHGVSGLFPGCPLEAAAKTGEPLEREVYDHQHDRWMLSSVFPTSLLTQEGQRIFYHTSRDITEVKTAAQEQERLQAQLIQAQKLESIGRLAGGIAHDFNNILTAILGLAGLVSAAVEKQPVLKEDLQNIIAAAQRGVSLSRQLLTFSRKEIRQPKVLNVNEVMINLEKLLYRIIGEDIRLVFRLSPGLWRIKIDPTQIEQVMINLAVNARDAMVRGGTLSIETMNITPEESMACQEITLSHGHYVAIRVSDTGSGMSPDTLNQIFEPFFTTKTKGKGTGLGLSTIYGIIKQAQGQIAVSSAPGCGAIFAIYLPASKDVPLVETKHPLPAVLAGQGERILVVDDDQMLRSTMSRILIRAGYQVLQAASGDEALQVVESTIEPILLLITDVIMPGMSGKELAYLMAQRQPAIKLLFMSGYSEEEMSHYGVTEIEIDFLPKPFDERELLEKIFQLLSPDVPRKR